MHLVGYFRSCIFIDIEARSRNHCCRGNEINITYSECVSVAFVSQHPKRMRRITSPFVTCLAVSYIYILSHKRHDFWGKNSVNIKLVFWFSLQFLSEACLILSRIQRNAFTNVHLSSCEVPLLFLSDFNEPWIFSTGFRKILKYQISWKSIEWELNFSMRTDGHTHRHDTWYDIFNCNWVDTRWQ